MHLTARFSALLVALALCAVAPQSAAAGEYTVHGCANWAPYNWAPAHVAVYSICPGVVVRNAVGNFSSPTGAEGGWTFTAPWGTLINAVGFAGTMRGAGGWQAATSAHGGGGIGVFMTCPGASCRGAVAPLGGFPIPSAATLKLRVRCGSSSSCPNNGLHGAIELSRINVTLSDTVSPTARITGGSLIDGRWRAGTQNVVVAATDNTGVRALRAYVGGSVRSEQPRPGCAWGALLPCPNSGGTITVSTAGLSDGRHRLAIEAVDTGGLTASEQRDIYVDNTAPAQPLGLRVDGSAGWRAQNAFLLRWSDPRQTAAPVVAAAYRFCPSGSSSGPRCATRSVARRAGNGATGISAPGPGLWDARIWLVDAAGNHNAASGVVLRGLGFDPAPPKVAIAPPATSDPTRVRVLASDDVSRIAGGEVEIQREGSSGWTSLPTQLGAGGLTAVLDDSQFPDGSYRLRARVQDAAGNERSTLTRTDGSAARLDLPLRIKTRLAVGKVKKVRARTSRKGKPRYRRILVTRPRTGYGRTIRLNGRLTTPGANPVVGAPVDVFEQVQLPGAPWRHVASVPTSRTGRFTYKALRGPSRLVRFQYSGTTVVRPRTSIVALLVRGSTSIDVDRRRVVNGEDVVFRGQVRGRPLPPQGKLVELQVYTRGKWRTFAQPRADATTGRWSYRYRFESVRGVLGFRFRARVRKETGYAYELGRSRRISVIVRGV